MKKQSGNLYRFSSVVVFVWLLIAFSIPTEVSAQQPTQDLVPNPQAEAYIQKTLETSNTVLLSAAFPNEKDRVISGTFLSTLLKSADPQIHPWITLKDVTIVGDVVAYNIEFPYDLFLYNLTFKNMVNMGSSHFKRLRIQDSRLEKFIYLDQSVTDKNLELNNDVFQQGIYFKGAIIGADLLMKNCKILGKEPDPLATYATYPSEFWQMSVGRSAVFDGTYFEGETTFQRSSFASASFANVQFGGKSTFSRVHVDSDTSFAGAVFYGDALFDQTSFGQTDFKGAQFQGISDFQEMMVDGDLNLTNTVFDLEEEPVNFARLNVSKALRLDSILAPGGLELREGIFGDLYLSVAGPVQIPAINLTQAEIDRHLEIDSLQVGSLHADGLINNGTLTLHQVKIYQALDLRNSRLNLLVVKDLSWPDDPQAFNLRGMTYTDIDIGNQGLTESSWRGLLQIINQSAYSPQEYQTLADFLANKGHPDWAQEVRLAMKRRERDDALSPFSAAWFWSWFLEIFAGYGYRPSLAFIWSALVVAIGAWVFRKPENMIPVDQDTVKLNYNPVLYSFALFLPYIDLGIAGKWIPNPQNKKASLYRHIHQILGWILMPIALLAFGGVLG